MPIKGYGFKKYWYGCRWVFNSKKQLSEALVGNDISNSDDNVNALADAFSISDEEAFKVLHDCDNDLRTAMKLLRMKALENSE